MAECVSCPINAGIPKHRSHFTNFFHSGTRTQTNKQKAAEQFTWYHLAKQTNTESESDTDKMDSQ